MFREKGMFNVLSCGPSLPRMLSDHQIVQCGGPAVYQDLGNFFDIHHYGIKTYFFNVRLV